MVPHSGQRGWSSDGNGVLLLSCGVTSATAKYLLVTQALLSKALLSVHTAPGGAPDLLSSSAGRLMLLGGGYG